MYDLQKMLSRIKNVCKEKNISYKDLSEMTDISLSTLSKIMAGIIKDPSITSITKIALALDVTIDYLVFGERLKNEIKQEIIQYKKLNLSGRQKVDDYINDLLINPKYTKIVHNDSNIAQVAAYGDGIQAVKVNVTKEEIREVFDMLD